MTAGARRRKQHRVQAAARGADEDRGLDLHGGENRQHIGVFDFETVILPVPVISGKATAAIIEGQHPPLCSFQTGGERARQAAEIRRIAREPSQADDRDAGIER